MRPNPLQLGAGNNDLRVYGIGIRAGNSGAFTTLGFVLCRSNTTGRVLTNASGTQTIDLTATAKEHWALDPSAYTLLQSANLQMRVSYQDAHKHASFVATNGQYLIGDQPGYVTDFAALWLANGSDTATCDLNPSYTTTPATEHDSFVRLKLSGHDNHTYLKFIFAGTSPRVLKTVDWRFQADCSVQGCKTDVFHGALDGGNWVSQLAPVGSGQQPVGDSEYFHFNVN
jgi:hypothetical protein